MFSCDTLSCPRSEKYGDDMKSLLESVQLLGLKYNSNMSKKLLYEGIHCRQHELGKKKRYTESALNKTL